MLNERKHIQILRLKKIFTQKITVNTIFFVLFVFFLNNCSNPDKNPDIATDNYPKVTPSTHTSSNEWVKNHQIAGKASSESDNKGNFL